MTTEQQVAELAAALGFAIPGDRLAGVVASLQSQIAGGGGLPAEELDGVEPAIVFDPGRGERP